MNSKQVLFIFSLLITSICNAQVVGPPTEGNPSRGKEPEVFNHVEKMPEYPGGPQEMMRYIQKNIKVNKLPLKQGTKVKGFYKFVVDSTGTINEVTAVKPAEACPECDQEAMRVLKSMPKWTPGSIDGKPVPVFFNIPINFNK